jgi:hypothetical protein
MILYKNTIFQFVVISIISIILIFTVIKETDNPNKINVHDKTIETAIIRTNYENQELEFPYQRVSYVMPN